MVENILISQKYYNSVGAVNTNVDGTLVRLPNLTLSKSQSDMKRKRKASEKKKRTVKELKKEIESKSLTLITCFFGKNDKKTQDLDYNGKSNEHKFEA